MPVNANSGILTKILYLKAAGCIITQIYEHYSGLYNRSALLQILKLWLQSGRNFRIQDIHGCCGNAALCHCAAPAGIHFMVYSDLCENCLMAVYSPSADRYISICHHTDFYNYNIFPADAFYYRRPSAGLHDTYLKSTAEFFLNKRGGIDNKIVL